MQICCWASSLCGLGCNIGGQIEGFLELQIRYFECNSQICFRDWQGAMQRHKVHHIQDGRMGSKSACMPDLRDCSIREGSCRTWKSTRYPAHIRNQQLQVMELLEGLNLPPFGIVCLQLHTQWQVEETGPIHSWLLPETVVITNEDYFWVKGFSCFIDLRRPGNYLLGHKSISKLHWVKQRKLSCLSCWTSLQIRVFEKQFGPFKPLLSRKSRSNRCNAQIL